jgi:hydrogenase nickel incorporation protein HypB
MCGGCGCAGSEVATILDMETGRRTVLERNAGPGPVAHRHGEPGHHHHGTHDHHHDADHDHHGSHGHADGKRHHHEHGHPDGQDHHHEHAHGHAHHPAPRATTQLDLERRILDRNDAQAGLNRAWLAGREILALNLVSSPGSGKTTLIERTIHDLKGVLPIYVIEGDQATANDAERIRKAGAPAIQVNTGSGCHLEADMVDTALRALKPAARSLLIIENVGNLVCPALFDLGERAKVAIFSVTEGEDKPLKYPHMFAAVDVVLINKTDLLPHVDFDMRAAAENARRVKPGVTIFELSARTGEGFSQWCDWLLREAASARETALR